MGEQRPNVTKTSFGREKRHHQGAYIYDFFHGGERGVMENQKKKGRLCEFHSINQFLMQTTEKEVNQSNNPADVI